MPLKFNPFTGKLDFVGISKSTSDSTYLKLDQTTPQTVQNGSPTFDKGLTISEGEKLILDG